MMIFGLRGRFLISHLLVAVVATASASLYLYISFRNLQIGYHEHSLLASAYALADAFETDFGTPRGNDLIDHVMRKLAREEFDEFVVLDANDKVIDSTVANLQPGTRLPPVTPHSSDGHHASIGHPIAEMDERVVAEAPIKQNAKTVGKVRVWIREKDYQASLVPIKRLILLALLGVSALCVLLSCLLARALLVPIREMRQLSKRIAGGDFSIRVKKPGKDELAQLANDLNAMALRLQDLENARRNFVGNVSHEMRSPVSNIRVAGEVLGRRVEKLEDDSAGLFEKVVAETERLDAMINELMELSAIESGALYLKIEKFNVASMLAELIESNMLRAEQKRLSLVSRIDSDIYVQADRERLARAISNLLDNAVKFSRDGGQVTVSAHTAKDCAVIEVSDTGDGISTEDLPRVFERFYRADKARQRNGGTGIGLSLVKHIVEAHDGSVAVSSKEGCGATFTVTIPLVVQHSQDHPHPDIKV